MKTKSCLSYFGSDSEVAKEIASYFDNCSHVSIPFVGGASIIPWLKARGIVANDLNSYAIGFYKALKGYRSDDLVTMCMNTLSHPQELYNAHRALQRFASGEGVDSIELAWAYWAVVWVGRKGMGGTDSLAKQEKASVRWTAYGGNNASRLQAVKGDLLAWAKEFERCEFTCECYNTFIPKIKAIKGNGVYCDAPWVGLGSDYMHKFFEADHAQLAELLGRFKDSECKVLLRYGDHALVRGLYEGWKITERTARNQANKPVKEIWITNERQN